MSQEKFKILWFASHADTTKWFVDLMDYFSCSYPIDHVAIPLDIQATEVLKNTVYRSLDKDVFHAIDDEEHYELINEYSIMAEKWTQILSEVQPFLHPQDNGFTIFSDACTERHLLHLRPHQARQRSHRRLERGQALQRGRVFGGGRSTAVHRRFHDRPGRAAASVSRGGAAAAH